MTTSRPDPIAAALAALHNTGSALRAIAGRAERDILADVIAAAHAAGYGGATTQSNQSGVAGLDALIRGILQQPTEELKQMALDIKQQIEGFAAARQELQGLITDVKSALLGAALAEGSVVVSQSDIDALDAERQATQGAVDQLAKALPNSQVQVAGGAGAGADASPIPIPTGLTDTGSNPVHPSAGLE